MKREDVVAALRAEEVAKHYGIAGPWRGRWMRSRRCARTDHSSDAFGLARDGMWHCWACDEGGDLLKLIAVGEGLDIREDFPRVLELAAAIAGLEDDSDDFGGPAVRPPPKERPPAPPVEPIGDRIMVARRRGKWIWSRLRDRVWAMQNRQGKLLSDAYLDGVRRIKSELVKTRADYRDTPLILGDVDASRMPELVRMAQLFSAPGIAVAVRSPRDGAVVDIRVRRFDPKGDQPKIVGMLGGLSSYTHTDRDGKTSRRELIGCYGHPTELEHENIVVVEGLIDYLTALAMFPTHDVLGAVEAGSLSLVAQFAAESLASRNANGRLLLVEHNDGERLDKKTGAMVAGAGDRAMNEDVNAATKLAVSALGPRRVGWLLCEGPGIKDLNDLWRTGAPYAPRWWADVGEGVPA